MNLDQLDKACEHVERIARGIFERDGRVAPAFFVFGTRDPSGRRLDQPAMFVTPWIEIGGNDKRKVRANQQRMADILCALATVNIMEMWQVDVVPQAKGSIVHEVTLTERPGKDAKRFEIVCLRGECREGVIHRLMRIDRPDDGPPRLGETKSTRVDRTGALIEAEASVFAGYFPERRGKA
jgi:hypothetical protein